MTTEIYRNIFVFFLFKTHTVHYGVHRPVGLLEIGSGVLVFIFIFTR